jgi:hypothetical protein
MLIASARPELARVLGVADLDRRTSKLERRQVNTLVAARLAPWTPATLQGPWVNEGGTETTAAYYIDAAGFVHLKGSIKAYLAPPTGALVPPPLQPSVCTTLPVGYRPSERYTFPTPLSYDAGYDGSGAVIAGINGTITIEDRSNYGGVSSGGVGAPSDPDTVHVNLDGILFRT